MSSTGCGRSFGFVALVVALAASCSASEDADPPRTSSGSGAGAGTIDIGGGEGASSSGGSVGVGNRTGAGASSGLGFGGACAADIVEGKLIPLDVHIMLDTSLSMLEAVELGVDKWEAVKEALEAFLLDESSAGIGVGIQYFPLRAAGVPDGCLTDDDCGAAGPCRLKVCALDPLIRYCTGNGQCGPFGPCMDIAYCAANPLYVCNNPNDPCGDDAFGNDLGTCLTADAGSCDQESSCDVADYSEPAEPIRTLPDGAGAILASIGAKKPEGNTPTAAALAGALTYARSWAEDHPDHTVVTLFATDGFPTQCAPNDFPTIAGTAAAARDATPSVATYVIGVFPPGTPDVQENLDLIAEAGGTEQAFVIDTDQDIAAEFLAALNAIRSTKLSCEFQVPEAPPGEELDYDGKVNLQLVVGDRAEVLPYVVSADNCGLTQGGWYYDVDPESGATPSKILVCPSTCDAFQDTVGGQVEIALGCETVTTIVK